MLLLLLSDVLFVFVCMALFVVYVAAVVGCCFRVFLLAWLSWLYLLLLIVECFFRLLLFAWFCLLYVLLLLLIVFSVVVVCMVLCDVFVAASVD